LGIAIIAAAGIALLAARVGGMLASRTTNDVAGLEPATSSTGRHAAEVAVQGALAARRVDRVDRMAENAPGTWVPALLLDQNDWKNVFDRLDTLTTLGPAERLFYKALILETCSFYPQMAAGQDPALLAAIRNGTLGEFAAQATASIKDPRRRAATAFGMQRNLANACKGFAGTTILKSDIAKAYAQAAESGDLKAQARLLQYRQLETATGHFEKKDMMPAGFSDPISPSEREMLVATLFTEDPIAIRIASNALSMGTMQQSLRFGPGQADLGSHAEAIWTLVACEFGLECGARNMAVGWECQTQGKCAGNFPDYLREFVLTPEEFVFAQRTAAAIVQAIRHHDASAFVLVSQPGQAITNIGGGGGYLPPIAIR
jgi:hypothetical protein